MQERDMQNGENTHLEPETSTPLGKLFIVLSIAVILISAVFWIANVSSTASHADQVSQQNAQEIQHKADRSEVEKHFEHIENQLDSINAYLRDHK